jgi:hypothetical protein
MNDLASLVPPTVQDKTVRIVFTPARKTGVIIYEPQNIFGALCLCEDGQPLHRNSGHAIIVPMDTTKMLAELREEREGVEQAILVLERMAAGRGKRRGRPPKWGTGVKRLGRPPGSKNRPKE